MYGKKSLKSSPGGSMLNKKDINKLINQIDSEIDLRNNKINELKEDVKELRIVQEGLWELTNGKDN